MAVVSVRTDTRVLWCVTCDTFLGLDGEVNFDRRFEDIDGHREHCKPVDLRWLKDKRIIARIEAPV